MPKMQGFSFFEKRKLKNAIHDGRTCIDKALQESFVNNDGFQRRMDKYFGNSDGGPDATSHIVMKSINSMKLAIDTDNYHIVRGSNGGNENARMTHFAQKPITFGGTDQRKAKTARLQGTMVKDGKNINVLERTIDYAATDNKLPMTIYDLYFAAPHKLKDSQSQVQIFLHELSHLAAGTIDVDKPNCYDYNGVLYCKGIKKGAVNAESYGMFLQSYLI